MSEGNGKIVGYCHLKRRHSIRVFEDNGGFWYEISGDYGVGGKFDIFEAAKERGMTAGDRLERQYLARFSSVVKEPHVAS